MNIKYSLTFWNQSTSGFLVLSFLPKFHTPQQKAATKKVWVFLQKNGRSQTPKTKHTTGTPSDDLDVPRSSEIYGTRRWEAFAREHEGDPFRRKRSDQRHGENGWKTLSDGGPLALEHIKTPSRLEPFQRGWGSNGDPNSIPT